MQQCKLDDGSQYLISAIQYSHKSDSLCSSAISQVIDSSAINGISGLTIIPQSTGVIVKHPSYETMFTPYSDELEKACFSHDVELNGNNFRITDEDGDSIAGLAVLVPAEQHVDFTVSE